MKLDKVDKYISDIADWRGEVLATLRKTIHDVDPEIVEDWKWEVPIFVHGTMVCAISSFKDHVKINFFKGALIDDSQKLFNGGLDSKKHRSIDFFEGDKVDTVGLKDLIEKAIALQ